MDDKIKSLEELKRIRALLRKENRKVVFTNGCFDLLHAGHVHLIRRAKSLGDVLIVAVNDDASVTRLKGNRRPIFPLEERLEVLSAFAAVDYLVAFSEDTPLEPISALVPDRLVKGGDWVVETVVGREVVERAGGEVVIVPYEPGRSTTEIIARVASAAP